MAAKLLVWATAVRAGYALTFVACGIAGNSAELVAVRLVQGLGAGDLRRDGTAVQFERRRLA